MSDLYREVVAIAASSVPDINVAAMNSDTNLIEAGVDSLDLVEIALNLENAFGVSIPSARLRTVRSLSDLAATISEAISHIEKSN